MVSMLFMEIEVLETVLYLPAVILSVLFYVHMLSLNVNFANQMYIFMF